MSLATWKEEFYRKPASPFRATPHLATEATLHSLAKWQGLTEQSLAKHGLRRGYRFIEDKSADAVLAVDHTTCALCQAYEEGECALCPLYLANGEVCEGAFSIFLTKGDPAPMLEMLEITLEYLEQRE